MFLAFRFKKAAFSQSAEAEAVQRLLAQRVSFSTLLMNILMAAAQSSKPSSIGAVNAKSFASRLP